MRKLLLVLALVLAGANGLTVDAANAPKAPTVPSAEPLVPDGARTGDRPD